MCRKHACIGHAPLCYIVLIAINLSGKQQVLHACMGTVPLSQNCGDADTERETGTCCVEDSGKSLLVLTVQSDVERLPTGTRHSNQCVKVLNCHCATCTLSTA